MSDTTNKNQILVTGGAGFIGSNLVERLLKDGCDVICLDNFNDYYDPQIKRRNIAPFLNVEKFHVVEADVRDIGALKRVFGEYEIQKVVHLAAQPGVRLSLLDPSLYIDINYKGTLNLLEMCKTKKIENIVFASSSSVYGDTKKIPFIEAGATSPISPYGVSKRATELLCYTYNKLYHIPVTMLRFFAVYGPRQRPDMAIYKFIKFIDDNKEIIIYGNGESCRDYTYVTDIIEGIILALKSNFDFQIFNLGNSNPVSLSHLISVISKCMKKTAKIKYIPDQMGDPYITYADISKAKELLNYCPKIKIDEGIARYVEWCKYGQT
jgi:UDP-glucuronate 4-epimerase